MTFTYRHRKQIILICVALLSLAGLAFWMVPQFLQGEKKKEKVLVLKTKQEEAKTLSQDTSSDTPLLQVDIKGAVNAPGIYSVKDGSRVIDVIRLAGDLLENADTSVLNLSKKVFDEMVIIVYTKEEVSNFKAMKELESFVEQKCIEGNGTLKNDACLEEDASQEEIEKKVSLNTASKEELLTLPGIGEAKADAILKYREEHGSFQTIEELKEVPGIGDALFASLAENITL